MSYPDESTFEAIMEALNSSKEAAMPVSILKVQEAIRGSDGRTRYKRVSGSGNTVKFTPDTHSGLESDLALSITRHRIKDGKYVEYTIVVHQKGYQIFPIQRRYKQFEALHADMKKENRDYELPHLPTKRWFKTNKWDDDYHIDRRFALQLYLRIMAKFYAKISPVLRKFLELKEDLPDDYDDCQAIPSSERLLLEKMESMNSHVLQSLPTLARKVDADAAAVLEGVALPLPASSYHAAGAGGVLLSDPPTEATVEPIRDAFITGDRRSGGSTNSSSSDCLGQQDDGDPSKLENTGEEQIGEEAGAAIDEGDYMTDSIASSWHVTKKRIDGNRAPDDENRVAAQLNHTLLQHARSSESLAGRDMGSERQQSVEFLSGAGEEVDDEFASLGSLAKALSMQSHSKSVDSADTLVISRDKEKDEVDEDDDFEDDFDV